MGPFQQLEALTQHMFTRAPAGNYSIMNRPIKRLNGEYFNGNWVDLSYVLSTLSEKYGVKFFNPSTAQLEKVLKDRKIAMNEWTATGSMVFIPNSQGEYSPRVEPRLAKGEYAKLVHNVTSVLKDENIIHQVDGNNIIDLESLGLFKDYKYIQDWDENEGFPKKVGDEPSELYGGATLWMNKEWIDNNAITDYGERIVGRGGYNGYLRRARFDTSFYWSPLDSGFRLRPAVEGELIIKI